MVFAEDEYDGSYTNVSLVTDDYSIFSARPTKYYSMSLKPEASLSDVIAFINELRLSCDEYTLEKMSSLNNIILEED